MTEEHHHLVYGRINEALQAAWCNCGQVWNMKTEKWEPPRYLEGTTRRANWRGEE